MMLIFLIKDSPSVSHIHIHRVCVISICVHMCFIYIYSHMNCPRHLRAVLERSY